MIRQHMIHLQDQAAALLEDRSEMCNHTNGLFLSASTCVQQNILPQTQDMLRGSMCDLSLALLLSAHTLAPGMSDSD